MTVAVLGSRDYLPMGYVRDYIGKLPEGTKVLTSGWTDVDRIAGWEASRVRGLPLTVSYLDYPDIVALADKLAVFWDGQDMEIQDLFMKAIADGKPVSIHYESGKVVER